MLEASGIEGIALPALLKEAGLAKSTSEARQRIAQGAVLLNGTQKLELSYAAMPGSSEVYQVGKKRFARIVIKG